MFILDVIPLTILPQSIPQILSYFHDQTLLKGSVVEVLIGNRKIRAVVVSSSPIEEQKASLKKTLFQLKKISAVIESEPQISEIQFKIALWLAKHYYAPLGYCLKTVLPSFFLKRGYKVKQGNQNIPGEKTIKPSFIVSPAIDSIDAISGLIDKVIRNGQQALIITPDKTILDYLHNHFSLKYNSAKISSGLPNKTLYDSWSKISSGETQLILGTRQVLFMPFRNLGIMVLEDPLHEFYKSDMMPRYNTPDLAQRIANLYNSKLTFISPFMGVSDYFQAKNSKYDLDDTINREGRPIEIVNMVNNIKDGNYSILSANLKEQMAIAIDQKKKILILSSRRGYSGILICQNCGSTTKCPDCGIPMRIHKNTDLILVCHHCSKVQTIPKFCSNCSSNDLKSIGPAGSQKIYEEIKRSMHFGQLREVPVLVLDADVVKNETEEEEVMEGISKSGGSILIATQMIFSHRYSRQFDMIGIVNFDTLNPSPDFRAEEGFIYQMEKIFDFNPQKIVIQTYNRQDKILKYILSGNYSVFYDEELDARRAFYYPPFSRLVKLSFKHKIREKASYAARINIEKLKMAISRMGLEEKISIIGSSPAFLEKDRGFYVYNIVIKTDPSLNNLGEVLRYCQAGWTVDIDPRTIL